MQQLVQLLGICPANPCSGLADAVVQCLGGSPLDIIYWRCCAERTVGKGDPFKSMALMITCSAKGRMQITGAPQEPASQGGVRPTQEQVGGEGGSGIIQRVADDMMQCPRVPCAKVSHGKIVECLHSSFELVYARCCRHQGVLGSKAAAFARTCG